MQEFIQKITQHIGGRYFSYWAILLMDALIVAACALLAYLSVCQLASITVVIKTLVYLILFTTIGGVLSSLLFNTYRHTIRHSRIRDLWRIGASVAFQTALLSVLLLSTNIWGGLNMKFFWVFILFNSMFTLICLIGIRVLMIVCYESLVTIRSRGGARILIYGIDEKSVSLEMRLRGSKRYRVVGFYTYGKGLKSYHVAGSPVYYFTNEQDFNRLTEKKEIQGILFTGHDAVREEQDRLLRYCEQQKIKTLIAPSINESGEAVAFNRGIRNIKIEDLLGREEISVDMANLVANFQGKTVFVTGAAGSIGRELSIQLAGLGVKKLILFDSAETPLHNLRLEMEAKFPELDFVPVIGDVRVKQRLEMVFELYKPQVVLHAAAYKHVPLMEENPCEAVLVNVTGSRQVADMCVKHGAEKMIMVSTDKAVNPTNVMGASKRLAEIYVQSLGIAIEEGKVKGKTRFITTRFGNVLGSNGSVIPRFREQIENGGPVTVTHPDIIRFFMTIPEACRLVLEAALMGKGNEIFVFKMGEPVKIVDMARRMIELAGYEPDTEIKIEFTGLRPGEKLYEEVLSAEENSIPTHHQKISIAKARKYEYGEILSDYDEFERLSRAVEIDQTVRRMKDMVPEFLSKNSKFEKMDKMLVEK